MLIVAGTSNTLRHKEIKWPAAYPETISVAGISKGLPAAVGAMGWVDISVDGDMDLKKFGFKANAFGSSLATGKIAGALGYYDAINNGIDKNTALRFLEYSSKMQNITQREFATGSNSDKKRVYQQNLAIANLQSMSGIR